MSKFPSSQHVRFKTRVRDFQADLRVGRRNASSNIFQKTLELELRRDTAVDALGELPGAGSSAPQRTGSGSLALGTAGTAGTATAALQRQTSRSATLGTASAATAGASAGAVGAGQRSETFQSEELRWDRTVSLDSGGDSRVLLIVDDLALAPKTKTGVRPVLEFLRQLLETGLGRTV